jgi:hypothetical protein
MSRLGVLLVAALCAGCAAPPPPAPPQPPRVVQWRVVRAPVDGFSVSMPLDVQEVASSTDTGSGTATTHGFETTTGPMKLRAVRTSVPGRLGEDAVLERVRALVDRSAGERDAPVQGYPGRVIEGVRGNRLVLARVVVVGRYVYVLSVEALQDTLDRDAARTFLDSLRIEPSFRVAPSREGRCTVAVPWAAATLPLSDEGFQDAFFAGYQGHRYVLGGDADLAYVAASRRLPPGQASADQLLAEVVATLGRSVSLAVQQSAPLRLGALQGVEARYDGRRVQLFTNGTRLWMFAVMSRDRARLDDDDARRFFASLRVAD